MFHTLFTNVPRYYFQDPNRIRRHRIFKPRNRSLDCYIGSIVALLNVNIKLYWYENKDLDRTQMRQNVVDCQQRHVLYWNRSLTEPIQIIHQILLVVKKIFKYGNMPIISITKAVFLNLRATGRCGILSLIPRSIYNWRAFNISERMRQTKTFKNRDDFFIWATSQKSVILYFKFNIHIRMLSCSTRIFGSLSKATSGPTYCLCARRKYRRDCALELFAYTSGSLPWMSMRYRIFAE